MAPRPLRIGLYGPYGCGNLGDAAIQESALHNIRARLPEAELLGISLDPANTERIHGIPAFPIQWSWRPDATAATETATGPGGRTAATGSGPPADGLRNLLRRARGLYSALRFLRRVAVGLRNLPAVVAFGGRMLATLRRLDYLVISGGGQISDDWGGPWDHPIALLVWVAGARVTATRVHMLSIGAGPIRRPLSRRFFHLALRLAHSRSYRDRQSRAYLESLACTRNDPLHPDLAFSVPVDRPPSAPAADPGRLTVGVATMNFQGGGDTWLDASAERTARCESTLVEFIVGLLDNGHRVSLFFTQAQSDRPAYEGILRGLAARSWRPDGLRLRAEPTRDLAQLLTQIAATDMVVSARLHGLILPLRLLRPVIALSYQTKVDAVMGDFGLSEYCLSVDTMDAAQLNQRFATMQRDWARTLAQVRATAASHQTSLSRQFDRIFGPVVVPAAGHPPSRPGPAGRPHEGVS